MTSIMRRSAAFTAHERPVAGDVKMSFVNNDHLGWLKCDGRSLLTSQYNLLFQVIGYTFGGSGNTFNLPDPAGKVTGSVNTTYPPGTDIGSATHTLTIAEMPAHNHGTDASNTIIGNQQTGNAATGITINNNATGITTQSAGLHNHTGTADALGSAHQHSGTTDSSGLHTHTTNANGGQGGLGLATADGTNTVTDTDSSNGELNVWTTPYALTIDQNGAHTHTFTTNTDGTHSHNLTIANNGSHTHPITDPTHNHTITDPTHFHTIKTQGGGQAHNNIQPTLFIGNTFIYSGIPTAPGFPPNPASAWPFTVGLNPPLI